jgi:Type VI secretion system effector, Hcp
MTWSRVLEKETDAMKSEHSWKWLAPRQVRRKFSKPAKSHRSRPALSIERLEDRQVLSAVSPAAETGPPPSGDTQVVLELLQGGLKLTQDEFQLLKILGTSTPTEDRVQHGDLTIQKVLDKTTPLLFQLDDTLQKVGADLINGDLTDKKVMAAKDKIEYLEIKMTDVIITSVSRQTQDAAQPIIDALFADAASLVQGLLDVQGLAGRKAGKGQQELLILKLTADVLKIEGLTIKGEADFIKDRSPGLTVDDFQVKIEKVFQKANEAIMNLSDPDASALLPAVQDFETGILNLLGSLQGGEDFTGGVLVPPSDDVIT